MRNKLTPASNCTLVAEIHRFLHYLQCCSRGHRFCDILPSHIWYFVWPMLHCANITETMPRRERAASNFIQTNPPGGRLVCLCGAPKKKKSLRRATPHPSPTEQLGWPFRTIRLTIRLPKHTATSYCQTNRSDGRRQFVMYWLIPLADIQMEANEINQCVTNWPLPVIAL